MQASASSLLKEDLIVEIAGLNQAVGNAQVQYHRGQGLLLAQASAAGMLIRRQFLPSEHRSARGYHDHRQQVTRIRQHFSGFG